MRLLTAIATICGVAVVGGYTVFRTLIEKVNRINLF